MEKDIEEFFEGLEEMDKQMSEEQLFLCNDCDTVYPDLPKRCANDLCGSKSFRRIMPRNDHEPAERNRLDPVPIEEDECEWCGSKKHNEDYKVCDYCLERLYQLRQNLKLWYREVFQQSTVNLQNIPGPFNSRYEGLMIALNNEISRLKGDLEENTGAMCPYCGCSEFEMKDNDLVCIECREELPEKDSFSKQNQETEDKA